MPVPVSSGAAIGNTDAGFCGAGIGWAYAADRNGCGSGDRDDLWRAHAGASADSCATSSGTATDTAADTDTGTDSKPDPKYSIGNAWRGHNAARRICHGWD